MYPTTPASARAITVTLGEEARAYTTLADAVSDNARHIASAIRSRERIASRDDDIRIQAWCWSGPSYMIHDGTPELEFKDEMGFVVPNWLVEATFIGLGLPVVRRSRFSARPHVFRAGPVPGVSSRYGGCHYRRPRTTNERRAGGVLLRDEEAREHGVAPRKARIGHELPSAWDDVRRTVQRSWKEQRRNQWKD